LSREAAPRTSTTREIGTPKVSASARLPFGLRDLAITAGFLALFMLSRRWFFARFKPVLNLPHTGH